MRGALHLGFGDIFTNNKMYFFREIRVSSSPLKEFAFSFNWELDSPEHVNGLYDIIRSEVSFHT